MVLTSGWVGVGKGDVTAEMGSSNVEEIDSVYRIPYTMYVDCGKELSDSQMPSSSILKNTGRRKTTAFHHD